MNNFKGFDLIKNHFVNFKIYEEAIDNGDNIRIVLSSEEDLWNNGENKNHNFFYRYILGRDEWVKNQNYQGDDYIKYQKDFLEALKEFENITRVSEIKSQVGLYLIGVALSSINNKI